MEILSQSHCGKLMNWSIQMQSAKGQTVHTFCLFWRIKTAVDNWGPTLLFLIFELLHARKTRNRSLEPCILSRGLVTFISLLDTCKAHSLYFSVLSAWRNKVIKDTDNLKQARVLKNAMKTILKCYIRLGKDEGNTVTRQRGTRWLKAAERREVTDSTH